MEATSRSRQPLRPELEPQLAAAELQYPQVLQLIKDYDEASDEGDEAGIQAVIEQLCALTGKKITNADLFEYWEAGDAQELAFDLLQPVPVRVADLTPAEVAEIVYRLYDSPADPDSEVEAEDTRPYTPYFWLDNYYHDLLRVNLPNAYRFELFGRQKGKDGAYYEPTPAEIIARLLA